ncbi:MAG: ROK family protein [Bacilli bacterium]|nr:ROK family protein [Bacilli bacterium]
MLAIGIDIGGTSIKVGFVNEKGEIVHRFRLAVNHDIGQVRMMRDLGELVNQEIADAGLTAKDFIGVGVGCPGCINTVTGRCDFSGNLDWHDLDIVGMISSTVGLPTRVANDANAAMLGEAMFGAGKEYKNLILLTLGTGVGGGIYINGKLYEGNEGKGAEMGHMIVRMHGRKCTCGSHGCFETYASASALIADTKKAMLKHRDSKMWDYVHGDIDDVNGATAFECAKLGDEVAAEVVNTYEYYLAIGILNYCNIFRPDAVILGGGISGQREYLTRPIEEKLAARHYGFPMCPRVRVFVSELGNDAGILGAASLAFEAAR